MRFFASWWERLPGRVVRLSARVRAHGLVAVVVAAGLAGSLSHVVSRVTGNYWS